MAWVDPTDVSAGSVLTASKWNQEVVENTSILRALANVQQTVQTAASSFSVNAGTTSSDISGLTVAITPTIATSKVLVSGQVAFDTDLSVGAYFTLYRDGSAVTAATADTAGNRIRTTAPARSDAAVTTVVPFQFLDSPATTSSVTYSIRLNHSSASTRTVYINRGASDTDSTQFARSISVITAQEIPV